ncbi:MAG: GIY-YIG nuclease family protein [Bacteroidales bacterium]|nr:GIY-YIG nuclease family protein [Bacteroidales bacterium]
MYCVYVHTNKINGKIYVGQTNNTEERWRKMYVGCNHFHNAINHYGWINFNHEIIAYNLPKEYADYIEQQLIQKYKSYNPNYGYNMTLGGEGCKPTDETRIKMSESGRKRYKENPLLGQIIG